MNIALNELTTACCRESFHQIKTVLDQAECIVPDVYEDIGQIVSARAQICLKSKEIQEHTARIGASAEIHVFYITESRERVRCMSFSKDLDISFDSPSIDSDSAAQIALCCMGVQARAVNPRKISAQLSLRAELSCWTEGSFSIPNAVEAETGESVQLRLGGEDCVFTSQVSEKSFVVNEQIPLSAENNPTALSDVSAKLICRDSQPIGAKLLLKGEVELSIAYETPDAASPRFLEQSLPFSVLIDMPDENAALGRVILETTALYADLSDAINDSRVIELELHAVVQLSFERKETLSFLSDAFASACPTIIEESSVPICRSRSRDSLTVSASDRIRVEKERGEVVSAFADILSYAVRDGKAELSVAVSLLLRTEDGTFGAQQKLLSLDGALQKPGAAVFDAQITALRAERDGEEIVLSASALLAYEQSENAELRYLSSVELDTENAFDLSSIPSLTIARKGNRDLWELAKLYHSSVEVIEKMDRDHPMTNDLILIPRVLS